MNDRYLFKAKRIDNGEWVQGALFDGEKYCLIGQKIKFSPYVENECKIVGHEVDRTTICQCTALKDKRGTLIWENDVINTEIGKAVVGFDHATWRIKWVQDAIWRKDLWYWATAEDWSVEVVGNIFDNPELLEVE